MNTNQDDENNEVIDFTEADKEISVLLNELDKEEAELLAYYQNKQKFESMANKMEAEIASNNDELAKIEDLLESHKKELEELSEGSASRLLDNVMKEVTNSLLGPYGISASDVYAFDPISGNTSYMHNDFEKAKTVKYQNEAMVTKDGQYVVKDDYSKEDRYMVLTESQLKDVDKSKLKVIDKDVKIVSEFKNNGNQVDHIIAKKTYDSDEIYRAIVGTEKRVSEAANDQDNFKNTAGSLNGSKSDDSADKYHDRAGDKHGADLEKMKKAEAEANWNKAKHGVGAIGTDYFTFAVRRLIANLFKAMIKAMKIALSIKRSLKECIKVFIENLKKELSNIKVMLKDIFAGSVDDLLGLFLSRLTSVLYGFVKNLFKITANLFKSIIDIVKICFDKSKTWQQKIEAIAKLALITVVSTGVALAIEALAKIVPFIEPFKEILQMIFVAIASAVVVYWLDGFNRNKKQTEIEAKKLVIAEQEQGKNAILARNCTLHVALAMTSTGQSVSYFQYAFADIMRAYGKVLDVVDEMKDNMSEHNRKMECLDYQISVINQERKEIRANTKDKLAELRKKREERNK